MRIGTGSSCCPFTMGDLMRGKDRQPGGELFSLHWENFPKHEKKSHFAGI
jgi:hypothetical protein